jgi:hypothetical protein
MTRNFDFLRDTQAEAWAAQIRGEPYRRPRTFLIEAITLGWFLGGLAVCVYFAVQGV